MEQQKLVIYNCNEHEHRLVFLDGKLVFSNAYCVENVITLAEHLGWKLETITLSRYEIDRARAWTPLFTLPPGTRVTATANGRVGTWLKTTGDLDLLKWGWVNLETGEVLYYYDLTNPQRE